ncbi:hypothetical protein [Acidihalobacter ferrooxydans]|uniref:Uncharacterized protein n=1 Tax=Acidihalobacter ferrooxydans TaxID=1765967 RepID=A0A1P8UIX0_9GAMM|nr:hypothetical protein [Acidihalobacter ferrooxydans]APZ43763.1 hypothetical protein BW247_12260 [Acidihalobacter ferrooxydans]
MCGLCGALGQEDHWSAATSTKSTTAAERAQMRRWRIALLNRVLAARRLSLDDFQGSSYVLSSPTGRREVVQDLGLIWQTAEDMLGSPVDPLDPEFLQSLLRLTVA